MRVDGAIWLVGAGNMGGAMLRGWLANGIAADHLTVITRTPRPLPDGVRGTTLIPSGAPDTLVLAMKPQQLAEVAAGPLAALSPRLLVSVLAGVDGPTLSSRFRARHIVRMMPNLPAAIGKGVSLAWSDSADPAVRSDIDALAAPLGLVEWIDDAALFDAATALAGCGPGFTFRFIDALAAAGERLGLPAAQAARLALATVEGSALMAARGDASPSALADRVASPGGSTREGLNVLDDGAALHGLLARTLAASEARNRAMAADARHLATAAESPGA